MRKLIIQIPCYNEEGTIAATLNDLPREVPGTDRVEWLVVDDGSSDRTVEAAQAAGVDHVVRLGHHRGLSKAFLAGLHASLKKGADIIVNTDADNQYQAGDLPKLIEPILQGEAEMVVGARPVGQIASFSALKKVLQKVGSWAVRKASRTGIPDAASGFRALTREAALKMNVFNEHTYTLETIIQAGIKGMAVKSVPVGVNEVLRPSRLIPSVPSYIKGSFITIVRISMTYRPLRFFSLPGIAAFSIGFLIGMRFLYFYFSGGGSGHIQSLLLAAVLMITGVFLAVIGLVADLMGVNRKLLEEIKYRLQKIELEGPGRPGEGAENMAERGAETLIRTEKHEEAGSSQP